MFTLVELTLEPSNNKPLPIANGRFIHGLLFKRLSEVDPKYIDKLHVSHEAKPFALVPATAKEAAHSLSFQRKDTALSGSAACVWQLCL